MIKFCGVVSILLSLFNYSLAAETNEQAISCQANIKRLVAYYAHPLSIYGSLQEKRDIEVITAMGFEVLNPNAPEHDAGYKREGMEYFSKLIKEKADVVIFRGFPNGSIPAGVAEEIKEKKGLVLELPTAVLQRTLSVDATREFLKENGTR